MAYSTPHHILYGGPQNWTIRIIIIPFRPISIPICDYRKYKLDVKFPRNKKVTEDLYWDTNSRFRTVSKRQRSQKSVIRLFLLETSAV